MIGPPFFSLDGIDGAGKSTQCQLLADWLRGQGYPVVVCADPGGTALGAVIRGLLLDSRQVMTSTCEALLFMASRAQLVSEVIQPALDAGSSVVSDRYLLANVAYQGHGGGLDPELLWELGMFSAEDLQPDMTIVLDIPLEASLSRRHRPADRIEGRDVAFHARVREGFLVEAGRRPERIKVVDASEAVDVVHEHIVREVSSVLAARSRT